MQHMQQSHLPCTLPAMILIQAMLQADLARAEALLIDFAGVTSMLYHKLDRC